MKRIFNLLRSFLNKLFRRKAKKKDYEDDIYPLW